MNEWKRHLRQMEEREAYHPGLWDWIAAASMIGLLIGPLVVPWLLGYRP